MSKRDYYETLGLSRTSTEDDIKRSFRKLASKYHPDKYQAEGSEKIAAEEKFKEVKEAYEILSDPKKRAEYDEYGHSGNNPFQFNNNQSRTWTFTQDADDFRSVFDKILRDRTGGNFGFGPDTFGKTTSIRPIIINLRDAYVGRAFRISDKININIPQGIRSGTKLYVDGKIYKVEIQTHNKFKRSDDDLLVDVEISAIEAILGLDAEIEHLDGTKLQFVIPSGIQQNQIVRLAGKGMKNPEIDRVGDLHVRVSIVVPKNLSEDQKNIIRSLSHRNSIII